MCEEPCGCLRQRMTGLSLRVNLKATYDWDVFFQEERVKIIWVSFEL